MASLWNLLGSNQLAVTVTVIGSIIAIYLAAINLY